MSLTLIFLALSMALLGGAVIAGLGPLQRLWGRRIGGGVLIISAAMVAWVALRGPEPDVDRADIPVAERVPPALATSSGETLPPVSAIAPLGDPATATGLGNEAPPTPRAPNTHTGGIEDGALSTTRTAIRLFGDAKVTPRYDRRSDAMDGVQITRVGENSFWQELGIREGDVLLELNGRPINDHNSSVALMSALSREYVLILRVRGEDGSVRHIDYRTPE